MTTKPLKAGIGLRYLAPMVTAYVGFVTLTAPPDLSWSAVLQHVSLAGLLGLVVLALQELPTRALKEIVVHWRLHDRLPGTRAFSRHALQDYRIDLNALRTLLNPMPVTPRDQNTAWYAWLKQTEDAAEVADAHRRYLILRDTAVVSLLLALAALVLLALPGWRTLMTFLLFVVCAATYLLLSAAARSVSVRLVTTVIAVRLTRCAAPTANRNENNKRPSTRKRN